MNKNYNCACYLRLSKEDDKYSDESSSISSQRMIIESFAKYNGFNIIDEYVDDGYSGGNFDRPGFKRMLKDIETGKINCVITKDLSRLGREMYNTGTYIEQYFLEYGVRYIAINDSFDSSIGDSMLGIRLGVNDLYLRDVSKKVSSAFKIKQENGDYIGSIPCYGYIKDPNDHHRLIIDPEAAKIVKKIYNYALEGFGLNSICNKLSEEQIPIPIVYKKESRAKLVTDNDGFGIWKHSTVKNILTSEMYIGNMVQHTYKKQSYRSKRKIKVPREQHIIVPNTHEAIIDKETFDRVQEILKSRSVYTRGKDLKYVFTGILKCKECGNSLGIIEKKNKKNNSHYTICNLYKRKGKFGVCTQHRFNYNEIEEQLIEIIRDLCLKFVDKYDYESFIKKRLDNNNFQLKDIIKNIEITEKKIDKINNLIDTLYNDKIEGIISNSDFQRIYEEKSAESNKLKEKLKELNEKKSSVEKDNVDNNYQYYKNIIEEFIKLKKPTRNVITRLVEKVEISKNGEIDIYFRFKEISLNK